MKILVFGTFDHLHTGHMSVLNQALSRGDLVVIVARDATVEKMKGSSPEQSEQERLDAVRETIPQADVVLGDLDDYFEPIRREKPDLVLLGYDQKLPPGIAMEDFPCPVERMEPFEPEKYKSSLRKRNAE